MLQKTRNIETMKILERLRRQGAPGRVHPGAIEPIPLLGYDEEEEEERNHTKYDAENDAENEHELTLPVSPLKKKRLR